MAFSDSMRSSASNSGIVSWRVGDVLVESSLTQQQRCPSGSPLSALIKHLRKVAARNNDGYHSSEMKDRDGHAFPYILHYLSTGDLVYPLHEGFHRVDALLKELAFFGLVEDVLRSATHEGSSRFKPSKQRSLLTINTKSTETLSKVRPLTKCHSIQNMFGLGGGNGSSINVLTGNPPEQELEANRGANSKTKGHRFLNTVKHFLSLKTSATDDRLRFTTRRTRANDASLGGTGVFRPTSAQGSTLILTANPDYVTVFGQRGQLESIFPDHDVVYLKTTSSAFIDSQLVYEPNDSYSSSPCFSSSASSCSSTSSTSSTPPKRYTTQSETLSRLYEERILSKGFVITVQSHWRHKETFEVHHQWLLHKKNGSNSKHHGSIGKRLSHFQRTTPSAAAVPATDDGTPPAHVVHNPVARSASVLHRIFNKSSLQLHRDSIEI